MKKNIILLLCLCAGLFAQTGEQLFDLKCAMCHMKSRPTNEMKSSLIAPPISGVVKNVKNAFGEDKESVLAFIVSYTLEPSLQRSKCKPKAIQRFGLMPSQKGNVTPQELESIAHYMYAHFPLPKKDKKKF